MGSEVTVLLDYETIKHVIKYCNRYLVPDENFDSSKMWHQEWFEGYFSFLKNSKVQRHLGDAFYQARFIYELMKALNLPFSKQKGFVKFQIMQYASICEALIDYTIREFFKVEFMETHGSLEYRPMSQAISKNTKIIYKTQTKDKDQTKEQELVLCQQKLKSPDLKRARTDLKTEFVLKKQVISEDTKKKVDGLYDVRNNIHILKAAEQEYMPQIYEAKDSFDTMQQLVREMKVFHEKMREGVKDGICGDV